MPRKLPERKQLLQDYRLAFETPHGRRVLEDLKIRACYDLTTFHSDLHQMTFLEGKRALLLDIMAALDDDTEEEE